MTCLICAKTPCYGMLGHFWERFHWACMTARHAQPKTLRARLRLLWNDFVIHALLHRGGERCQDCGRGYALWKAEGDLWARVMGSGGLLCIGCFARRVYAQPWGRDGVTVILAAHQPSGEDVQAHPVAAAPEPTQAASVAPQRRVLCQNPADAPVPSPDGHWPDGKPYAIVCVTWPKPTRSFVLCTGWEHKNGVETVCACPCHTVKQPTWEDLLRSPQWKPFGSEAVERDIAAAQSTPSSAEQPESTS